VGSGKERGSQRGMSVLRLGSASAQQTEALGMPLLQFQVLPGASASVAGLIGFPDLGRGLGWRCGVKPELPSRHGRFTATCREH
jgi:hypothetical protein